MQRHSDSGGTGNRHDKRKSKSLTRSEICIELMNYDKGACEILTKTDLQDLEVHNIDKSYLKATRKKKRNEVGRMWQSTAGNVEDCSE